jgi:hypothetical protein
LTWRRPEEVMAAVAGGGHADKSTGQQLETFVGVEEGE